MCPARNRPITPLHPEDIWLTRDRRLPLGTSGGDHTAAWPDEAGPFLRTTLATGEPANFSFLADELFRRFGFKRSASNIRSHATKHMSQLLREPLKRAFKPRQMVSQELWRYPPTR